MNRATLLFVLASLGIQVGWRELGQGETEYIVQIDDGVIQALREGQSISSAVPSELRHVRRIRIQYGTDPVPQPELSYMSANRENMDERAEPRTDDSVVERDQVDVGRSTPIAELSNPATNVDQRSGGDAENDALARNQLRSDDPRRQGGIVARIPSADSQSPLVDDNNRAPPLQPPGLSRQGTEGGGLQLRDRDRNSLVINADQAVGNRQANGNRAELPNIDPVDDPSPIGRHDYGGQGGSISQTESPHRGVPRRDYGAGTQLPDSPSQDRTIPLAPTAGRLGQPPIRNHRLDQTHLDDGPTSPIGMMSGRPQPVDDPSSDHPIDEEEGSPRSAANDERTGQLENATSRSNSASDPWLITFFFLCVSMGGNVYLAWIARGFYVRYASVVRESRSTGSRRR